MLNNKTLLDSDVTTEITDSETRVIPGVVSDLDLKHVVEASTPHLSFLKIVRTRTRNQLHSRQ